jgi:C4-dicarboxylate-specific signal transduction histidine kinase
MVIEEDKYKIVELFRLRDEASGEVLEMPKIEVKIICYTGKEKFVQIASNVLLIEEDAFLQMTFVDITEQKNAEQQMQKMNEELEQRVIDRTSKLNKTLIDLRNEMSQRAKISKELQFKSEILERTTSVCVVFNKKGECIYVSPHSLDVFG